MSEVTPIPMCRISARTLRPSEWATRAYKAVEDSQHHPTEERDNYVYESRVNPRMDYYPAHIGGVDMAEKDNVIRALSPTTQD